MFFIRLCLSVVRDERPTSSAGLLEKFFVPVVQLPVPFFFLTLSVETLCVFTECLTLQCFCFPSKKRNPDDSRWSWQYQERVPVLLSNFFHLDEFILSDTSGPPTAPSSIKALLIIRESLIILVFYTIFCTFHFGSSHSFIFYDLLSTASDAASECLILFPYKSHH